MLASKLEDGLEPDIAVQMTMDFYNGNVWVKQLAPVYRMGEPFAPYLSTIHWTISAACGSMSTMSNPT